MCRTAHACWPAGPDNRFTVWASTELEKALYAAGRWQDARPPTPTEMRQTAIVAVPIASASAKVRSGPPKDGAADLELPVWAGVLPLHQAAGAPIPDAQLAPNVALPDYLRDYKVGGE